MVGFMCFVPGLVLRLRSCGVAFVARLLRGQAALRCGQEGGRRDGYGLGEVHGRCPGLGELTSYRTCSQASELPLARRRFNGATG